MANKIVELSKPYTVHDETFSSITIRPPTYKEIFMDGMGHPVEVQSGKGNPMLVTYPEVVDAYVQRLLVSPSYEKILGLVVVDALKLEEAVCSFFLEWRLQRKPDAASSSSTT